MNRESASDHLIPHKPSLWVQFCDLVCCITRNDNGTEIKCCFCEIDEDGSCSFCPCYICHDNE